MNGLSSLNESYGMTQKINKWLNNETKGHIIETEDRDSDVIHSNTQGINCFVVKTAVGKHVAQIVKRHQTMRKDETLVTRKTFKDKS
jgi:bacillopeptidase F (M6 metalloprotease family)